MKKVFILYGLLVLAVVILAVAKFNGFNILPSFNNAEATINGQTFKIDLAKDEKSRQVGLSNKKSMPENEGMLFVFPQKGKYGFWMKDTEIPLDIIHINDGKIVHIFKNTPPHDGKGGQPPVYTPTVDANYVLEINGGLSDKFQFKNGDPVTFKGVE